MLYWLYQVLPNDISRYILLAMETYYRRIYNSLAEQIRTGKLAAGDKIPSEKELCGLFGVSRITSKRALELLSEEGLVSRIPGKGSFVAENRAGDSRTKGIIGFVLPDFSDAFGTRLVYEVEHSCRSRGYQLVLSRTRDRIDEEAAAINALMDIGAAGILVLPVHGEYYSEEILKLILGKKPLIFVDRKMRGLAVPSFSTDNIAAAETGVDYLLRLGHRDIAFYSGPIYNTSAIEDRRQGYINALAARGIPHNPAFMYHGLGTWQYPFLGEDQALRDIKLVTEHLSAHPEITAVLSAEYLIALIVMRAAEKTGRSVPEDLSILCFDAPVTFTGKPPFTHIRQNEKVIGGRAVEALNALICGGEAPAGDTLVPAELVPGLSSGKKPGRRSPRSGLSTIRIQ
jgi:DNA-binding LacI/PurR family transcriptional regulator